jgi:hypothetical protein
MVGRTVRSYTLKAVCRGPFFWRKTLSSAVFSDDLRKPGFVDMAEPTDWTKVTPQTCGSGIIPLRVDVRFNLFAMPRGFQFLDRPKVRVAKAMSADIAFGLSPHARSVALAFIERRHPHAVPAAGRGRPATPAVLARVIEESPAAGIGTFLHTGKIATPEQGSSGFTARYPFLQRTRDMQDCSAEGTGFESSVQVRFLQHTIQREG